MNQNTKEPTLEEIGEFRNTNPRTTLLNGHLYYREEDVAEFLTTAKQQGVEQGKREAWEEAVKLSDEIERVEPDGGTRQWMAFKRFRNTLRDYLQALTHPLTSMHKVIQIMPVKKNGRQAIYSGITLTGNFTPSDPDAERDDYSLPAGTYELVPTEIEKYIKRPKDNK